MSSSSDSDDNSILPNLQKTRELWSQKSDGVSTENLVPKTPTSTNKSPHRLAHNDNQDEPVHGEVIRFEDKVDDDFDLPDVKSMKSQWEKPGPLPIPKKSTPAAIKHQQAPTQKRESPELVPVNREHEEEKEEYDIKLGALREKFELEAKASSNRVVWDNSSRENVSKAAVGEKKNIFESEIEAQRHYIPMKEGPVEVPAVELNSIKHQFEQRKDEKLVVPMPVNSRNTSKQRQISMSSDTSSHAEVVRYDDQPTEEIKFEIEVNSLRKRFEQAAADSAKPSPKPRPTPRQAVNPVERQRPASESEHTAIIRSSDPAEEEMIGQESVKERLASLNSRYKAMTGESNKLTRRRSPVKKRSTTDIEVETKPEEVSKNQGPDIVRSPPAGTKEKPDFKASIELVQARQVFEAAAVETSARSGRSSRSSSGSPKRRAPRSRSTPSPTNRSSLSTASSKSQSPVRDPSLSSISSNSSGRKTPSPRSRSPKKFGDPDIVVLEHTEVNYYYDDDGTRLNTKTKGPSDYHDTPEEMSNPDVIKPPPAGTKEEVDYVPSVNLKSVRSMFERPKGEETPSRGRQPQPKKTIVVEKTEPVADDVDSKSPERNPEIVRSTTAGAREEPDYQASIDLKSARSLFESSNKTDNYVPRNKIKEREEEVRRQRDAAAAVAVATTASPRVSESSESSGYEVVKSSDAGAKESPDYHLDLKATKKLFEGGKAPEPIKRESSTKKPQRQEIKSDVIRPEPAGTKEVPQFETSADMRSAKQRFENPNQEEEEVQRKDPIDIQEEKRLVMQKDQEIKEEVQKRLNSHSEIDSEKPEGEAVKTSSIQITISSVKKSSDEDEPEDKAKSDSDDTESEGEIVLENYATGDDSDVVGIARQHSVSSEDLVEKSGVDEERRELELELSYEQEEQDKSNIDEDQYCDPGKMEDIVEEQEEEFVSTREDLADENPGAVDKEEENVEEPAAAVVPVRVAIPEDLSEKNEEPEQDQEYGSYTNVIDYNKEAHHHSPSSDSESDHELPQTNGQVEPVVDEGSKQNGYAEDERVESPISDDRGDDLPSGKVVSHDEQTTEIPADRDDML